MKLIFNFKSITSANVRRHTSSVGIRDIIKNKRKMISPKDVAAKIAEMIFETKTCKDVNSVEIYSNNI